MSVTTFNNGIAVVSIPVSIAVAPVNVPGATLPWNGVQKPYQWTATLTVTAQNQSNKQPTPLPIQKYIYNGQNINVGMWIANTGTGLAWRIVSISAKTATTVSCTLQDINRYNTYRDPTKSGNGKPPAGAFVVFNLSDDGNPMVDPVPSGAGVNFLATLTSRFQYINNQYDIALAQPGNALVPTFVYGDVIAVDEPTQTFVLADTAHASTVIGTVTAVDDNGYTFFVNPIRKVVTDLNYLPGQVGQVIYVDNSTPGGLTTTAGGASVYLQLVNFTQSTTTSSTFVSATTPITTPGFTFYVNNVLATVGGTGTLTDVRNAVNAILGSTGVSAVLAGSFYIQFTAVDARAISFEDISGSVTTTVGLTSAENGTKAVGLVIAGASSSASGVTQIVAGTGISISPVGGTGVVTINSAPTGFVSTYGFIFNQATPVTTWTIDHNAGTENIAVQILNTGGVATFGTITPGSGYFSGGSGTFYQVPLTQGVSAGVGATADITVASGAISSVVLDEGGSGYLPTDTLTVLNSYLGGTGSGFVVVVNTISNPTAIIPDEILAFDINNTQVTFQSPQAGIALLTIFS